VNAISPAPLDRHLLDILAQLERFGPSKALFFEEPDLDALFKMRPRLIRLVPGHQDAVVDITGEGRLRLGRERPQR
jgi:hypothetical protein